MKPVGSSGDKLVDTGSFHARPPFSYAHVCRRYLAASCRRPENIAYRRDVLFCRLIRRNIRRLAARHVHDAANRRPPDAVIVTIVSIVCRHARRHRYARQPLSPNFHQTSDARCHITPTRPEDAFSIFRCSPFSWRRHPFSFNTAISIFDADRCRFWFRQTPRILNDKI